VAEKPFEVAAAMDNSKDQGVSVLDAIDDVARGDAPSVRHSEFGQKPGASAFLHVLRELPHGLQCDSAAFAT
jgi:hypothetical protein